MIKFLTQSAKGPLIGFGLSEGNIQKLKAGQPIAINLEDMGLPPGKVMIFYGRTELDMKNFLAPFIGSETEIKEG